MLNAGNIEQVGTPIELYEKPATTFVATFIGSPSMNLLPYKNSSGQTAAWLQELSAFVPAETAVVGVRPEGFSLATQSEAGAFTTDAKVDAVELVGAESYVHARLADDTSIIFSVAGRSQIAVGETVKISTAKAALHCFDKTGKRIETTA